jgi:hypothetical protein
MPYESKEAGSAPLEPTSFRAWGTHPTLVSETSAVSASARDDGDLNLVILWLLHVEVRRMDPTRLDEALHDRQDKAVRLQIRRG